MRDKLEQAKSEIADLKEKLKTKKSKNSHLSSWFFSKSSHKAKEYALSWMDYKIFEMPNCEKGIFHDVLKGFEEFSKLKGYIVYLSIDTSLNNKIACKFDLPEGNSLWSKNYIYKDLDEYMERIKDNFGIDDIVSNCTKYQEAHLKSNLKNRLLLIQHSYDAEKYIHYLKLNKKENELIAEREKLKDLEAKLRNLEICNNTSQEEKAMLELEISNLKFENDVCQSSCYTKDSIIECLKEILNEFMYKPNQVINVGGNLEMKNTSGDITANNSNVMLNVQNSNQKNTNNENLENLLFKILQIAEESDSVTKQEFIKVTESIQCIKEEIKNQNPKKENIERHLNVLGSISSIASLAGQVAPIISSLF